MLRKQLDKLVDIVHNADQVPDEVLGAINDVLAHAGDKVPWYKALVYKNGQFSKTAMFATLANFLVLGAYILSFFQGTVIGPWTVSGFDSTAASSLLLIINGTYVANRLAANKEQGNG